MLVREQEKLTYIVETAWAKARARAMSEAVGTNNKILEKLYDQPQWLEMEARLEDILGLNPRSLKNPHGVAVVWDRGPSAPLALLADETSWTRRWLEGAGFDPDLKAFASEWPSAYAQTPTGSVFAAGLALTRAKWAVIEGPITLLAYDLSRTLLREDFDRAINEFKKCLT